MFAQTLKCVHLSHLQDMRNVKLSSLRAPGFIRPSLLLFLCPDPCSSCLETKNPKDGQEGSKRERLSRWHENLLISSVNTPCKQEGQEINCKDMRSIAVWSVLARAGRARQTRRHKDLTSLNPIVTCSLLALLARLAVQRTTLNPKDGKIARRRDGKDGQDNVICHPTEP